MARKPRSTAADVGDVEQRLGIRFPDAYRAFASDRARYRVAIKHVTLFPVQRCDWRDDRQDEVVIGTTGEAYTLVLVARRGKLSSVVYERIDGRRVRRPDFAEWVEDTRPPTQLELSSDPRLRYAERLTGLARRCTCGAEVRLHQVCSCGHMGVVSDARIEVTPDARFPWVSMAAAAVTALKSAGRILPSGPAAVLALADALEHDSIAALVKTWRAGAMKVDVDAVAIRAAVKRARPA